MPDEVSNIGVRLTLDATSFMGGMKGATSALNTFQQQAKTAASGVAQTRAGGTRAATSAGVSGVNVSLSVSSAEISKLRTEITRGLGRIPVQLQLQMPSSGQFSLPNILGSMLSMAYGTPKRQAITEATRFTERFVGSTLPQKALGGQVSANRPVLVGERRPEVFVPKTSGEVVPSVREFYRRQEGARREQARLALLDYEQQRRHDQMIVNIQRRQFGGRSFVGGTPAPNRVLASTMRDLFGSEINYIRDPRQSLEHGLLLDPRTDTVLNKVLGTRNEVTIPGPPLGQLQRMVDIHSHPLQQITRMGRERMVEALRPSSGDIFSSLLQRNLESWVVTPHWESIIRPPAQSPVLNTVKQQLAFNKKLRSIYENLIGIDPNAFGPLHANVAYTDIAMDMLGKEFGFEYERRPRSTGPGSDLSFFDFWGLPHGKKFRHMGGIAHAWRGATARAYEQTLLQGGGTFPVGGMAVPTRGHAVGIPRFSGTSSILVDPNDPVAFMRAFHQQKRAGAPFVGTWLNEGQIYVDPSTVVGMKREAQMLARWGMEKAGWDIGRGEEWQTPPGVSRATISRISDIIYGRRRHMGGYAHMAGGGAVEASLTKAQTSYAKNVRAAAKELSPEEIYWGKLWYPRAKDWIDQTASQYGVPEHIVRGMTASLSATTDWAGNKTKVLRMLTGWRDRGQQDVYSRAFNPHAKANDILWGWAGNPAYDPWMTQLAHTPKTGQFYLNTGGDLDALTIDRWALRTATLGAVSEAGEGPLRRGVASAFFKVAKQYGMKPAEFQAALWLREKRLANPRFDISSMAGGGAALASDTGHGLIHPGGHGFLRQILETAVDWSKDPFLAMMAFAQSQQQGKAGGGRTGRGLYIVGEVGPELFVPNRMAGVIPPGVMAQIPKAQEGMQVIGQQRNELFAPPEDGWIIPNRLMNQIPHADEGARPWWEEPEAKAHFRVVGPGRMGVPVGEPYFNEGDPEPERRRTREAEMRAATAQRLAAERARREAEEQVLPRATATGAAPGTVRGYGFQFPPHLETLVRAAFQSAGGNAKDMAASFKSMGMGEVVPLTKIEAERQARYAKIDREAAAEYRAKRAAGEYIGSFEETVQQERIRRAGQGQLMGGRTPQGAVANVFSFLFGGRQQFSRAQVEAAQIRMDAERMATNATKTRAISEEKLAKIMGDTSSTEEERATATAEHEQVVAKAETAHIAAAKMLGDAEKKEMVTTAGVVRNLGVIIGSTQAYSAIMKATSMVIEEGLVPATGKFIDEASGFRATATRVTTALADQTRAQNGNYQAVVAQIGVTTGMSQATFDWVSAGLQASTMAKAGAKAFTDFSDVFKAGIGAQGRPAEGLYGGYGGVFGTALFAQQLGGGAGLTEQLVNDIASAQGHGINFGGYAQAAAGGAATGAAVGGIAGVLGGPLAPISIPVGIAGGTAIGGLLGGGAAVLGDLFGGTVEQAANPDALEALRSDVADALGRGARREGAYGYGFRGGISQAEIQQIQNAPGLPQEIRDLAGKGFAFTDAAGNIITNFKNVNEALSQFAEGLTIPDVKVWARTIERQLNTAFKLIDIKGAITRSIEIPLGFATQQIANPFPAPGAGLIPGAGLTAAQRAAIGVGAPPTNVAGYLSNQLGLGPVLGNTVAGWISDTAGLQRRFRSDDDAAIDRARQRILGQPLPLYGGGTTAAAPQMAVPEGNQGAAAAAATLAANPEAAAAIGAAIRNSINPPGSKPGLFTVSGGGIGQPIPATGAGPDWLTTAAKSMVGAFGKAVVAAADQQAQFAAGRPGGGEQNRGLPAPIEAGNEQNRGLPRLPGITGPPTPQAAPGQAAADQYMALINDAQQASDHIKVLRDSIASLNAVAAEASWANTTRLSLRGIADAAGMLAGAAGKVGGSELGQLEGRMYAIGRASQKLGLQLQAREIATNLAIAGFQAPGETGEERYMRQKEALITAGIQKKQLGYATTTFELSGKAWQIQAQRNLEDAQKAWDVSQKAHKAEVATAAAENLIAAESRRIAEDLAQADSIYSDSSAKFQTALDAASQFAQTFGDDLSTVIGQLGDSSTLLGQSSTGISQFLSAIGFQFTPNKGGKGFTVTAPSYAAGGGVGGGVGAAGGGGSFQYTAGPGVTGGGGVSATGYVAGAGAASTINQSGAGAATGFSGGGIGRFAGGRYTGDEVSYVGRRMASLTGLNAHVASVWAKSEQGYGNNPYGLSKPGQPGHRADFPSMDAGIGAAASWLMSSRYYGGVRNAIGHGSAIEARAIANSPWGPKGYYWRAWPKLDKHIFGATGFVGGVNSPTSFTVGEAGGELVAVLRNPRTLTGGGMGGTHLTVNINGPVVQKEADIRELARCVAGEVERVLGRKGQLLGLRGPAV